MKTPILATGLSGLVGSRIQELLGSEFEFTDLSFTTGIDITDQDQVMKAVEESSSPLILHMAAKTDVDGCEDDKSYMEEGAAWLVNVVGTQNIISAAQKYKKRLIYISTDFVFDGTKDFYREEDEINPVNWYGYTKSEGERLLQETDLDYAIIRLAYPFRAYYQTKSDFVRRIIQKAEKKEKILALTDHIFTPTFIDDIAKALNLFFQKNLTGIFHVVGSQSLTPFEAVQKILAKFNLKADIEGVKRGVFFKNRAFRPFKLVLKNDKITKLGIEMTGFDEGIAEVKKQLAQIKLI